MVIQTSYRQSLTVALTLHKHKHTPQKTKNKTKQNKTHTPQRHTCTHCNIQPLQLGNMLEIHDHTARIKPLWNGECVTAYGACIRKLHARAEGEGGNTGLLLFCSGGKVHCLQEDVFSLLVSCLSLVQLLDLFLLSVFVFFPISFWAFKLFANHTQTHKDN